MSYILYYSKYCETSTNYLQLLSKSQVQKDIHFICIDKRVKDSNNKTFIVLESGQKIILPESITRVPALLLLNQGYQVIYGEKILELLKPQQQVEVKKATQNNMEPLAFSFNQGGFGDIVSDHYSFLDQGDDELKTTGNGGMRQMHNYVDLKNTQNTEIKNISTENYNTTIRGATKMGEDDSNSIMEERIKKMQEERDADLKMMSGNRPLGII